VTGADGEMRVSLASSEWPRLPVRARSPTSKAAAPCWALGSRDASTKREPTP
jgi:hypothetical protein